VTVAAANGSAVATRLTEVAASIERYGNAWPVVILWWHDAPGLERKQPSTVATAYCTE